MYSCSTPAYLLKDWMVLLLMGTGPLIAFIMDRLFGDPKGLVHPIVLIGKLISFLEKTTRALLPKTKLGELTAGLLTVVFTLALSTLLPMLILYIFAMSFPALAVFTNIIWCWQILAARSLRDAGLAVEEAIRQEGLAGGRQKLAMIVGRDVQSLDEEGLVKATIETLAENTTDAVVAPLIFIALGGAPLGFLYKAVNTMDSMLGYRNERYLYFGRAAARLDDIVNFLPARLSGLLIVLASPILGSGGIKQSWEIFRRDRKKHASPNSGQTESAMAGALGVQLAGDAVYFGEIYEKPTIGDPNKPADIEDIGRACKLMYAASCLGLIISMIIGFIFGGYIYL